MFRKRLQIILSSLLLLGATQAHCVSCELYFEGTPREWVSQGQTIYETDDTGIFTVKPTQFGRPEGIEIRFDGAHASPWGGSNYWTLWFVPPKGERLTVGSYFGATRFPFQADGDPGMDVSGQHRGHNRLTGEFHVLELLRDRSGSIVSLAINFVQYGECLPDRVITGAVRINSNVPIDSNEPVYHPDPIVYTLNAQIEAIDGLTEIPHGETFVYTADLEEGLDPDWLSIQLGEWHLQFIPPYGSRLCLDTEDIGDDHAPHPILLPGIYLTAPGGEPELMDGAIFPKKIVYEDDRIIALELGFIAGNGTKTYAGEITVTPSTLQY